MFLRVVLCGWKDLGASIVLDLTGPEREARQVRSVPRAHLGIRSSQLGLAEPSSQVGPNSQPQGTQAEKLLKPGSMSSPTRREKIKSMLSPLMQLMKRRQGCRSPQGVQGEAFNH